MQVAVTRLKWADMRLLQVLSLLLLSHCASNAGPNVELTNGANAGAAGASPASNAAPAATFTQVYQALFPRITNAHFEMCPPLPPSDGPNGNFSTGTDRASTYAALVGKSSTSSLCIGKPFVVPKQPEASLLLQKLLPNPPCGLRMPNGGATLTDAQVEMVRSWIAAGAADD
jgi:hypothetical protein